MGPASLALRTPSLHGPAQGTPRSRAPDMCGQDADPRRLSPQDGADHREPAVGRRLVGGLPGRGGRGRPRRGPHPRLPAAAARWVLPSQGCRVLPLPRPYPTSVPRGCRPPPGPPPCVLPLGSHGRGLLRCGAGRPSPYGPGRCQRLSPTSCSLPAGPRGASPLDIHPTCSVRRRVPGGEGQGSEQADGTCAPLMSASPRLPELRGHGRG